MLDLTQIDSKTLFGQVIIDAGDTGQCRDMIREQMKDNFAMMVSIIGYDNAMQIDRKLVNDVNDWVNWKFKVMAKERLHEMLKKPGGPGRPKKKII